MEQAGKDGKKRTPCRAGAVEAIIGEGMRDLCDPKKHLSHLTAKNTLAVNSIYDSK